MPVPIAVFTGFVGAGKTTTILGLLKSLPEGYKACLLKNEFGDLQVDSQLATQSNLAGVSEILNGCLSVFLSLPSIWAKVPSKMLYPRRSDEDCSP